MYRALARQTTGDPDEYNYTRGEALHHFLPIWLSRRRHPLYRRYFYFDRNRFYFYLSHPDLSPSFAVLSQVLEVISNALRIRMVMKNAEGKKIGFGKGFNRHLCCRISVADEEASYSFSSPVLDNLGRDLINRLVAIKAQIPNTGLNVQESRWCGMQKSGEKAMEATRSSSPPQWATKEIANLRISAAKLKHVEKWSPQALYTFDIERIFPLMISHREHSSACF